MSTNEKVLMKGARSCTAASGVDGYLKNGVTHNDSNPRWNMREGFSPSSASGKEEIA